MVKPWKQSKSNWIEMKNAAPLLLLLASCASQRLQWDEDEQLEPLAAVTFQFTPTGWDQQQLHPEILAINLDRLEEALTGIRDRDLVVFPEYALTTLRVKDDRDLALNLSQVVPEPQGQTLCRLDAPDDSMVVSRLSCLAQKLGAALVANLVELEVNEEEEELLFNTNVAFDAEGRLQAKYRKFNLVEEAAFNRTAAPQLATFAAANATFGLLSGHDLLFRSPGLDLLELGVRHFAHPTAWVNTMPFLTGTQAQMGWAQAAGATLVSSCYLEVERAMSGAGVYFADHSFRTAVALESGGVVVDPGARPAAPHPRLEAFPTRPDPTLRHFRSTRLTRPAGEAETCHAHFCCRLRYAVGGAAGDLGHAHLLAFDGADAHGAPLQACGLVRCAAAHVASCAGALAAPDLRFEHLHLSGVFRSPLVVPSTLRSDAALPFSMRGRLESEALGDGRWAARLEFNASVAAHTFALYARPPPTPGPAGAATPTAPLLLLAATLALCKCA